MTIDSSGRVGIGNTTPGAPLTIQSDTSANNTRLLGRSTGNRSDIQFYHNNGTSFMGSLSCQDDSMNIFLASSSGDLKYTASQHTFRDENGLSVARIDSSGRLLLGTTTEGNTNADDLTVASSGNTGITIRSGTTSTSAIYMSDGTSGADEYRGFIFYDHGSNFMQVGTNGSNAMRIDSAGRVAIGTYVTPAATLHLNKSGTSDYTTLYLSNSGASGKSYQIGVGGNTAGAGYANSLYIYDNSVGQPRAVLDSLGNVGIGTLSNYDDSVLEVRKTAGGDGVAIRVTNNTTTDGSQSGIIFTNSTADFTSAAIAHKRNDNALIFYNGQTSGGGGFANAIERCRIDSSGRLLVGTTNARTDFYSGLLDADIQIEDSSYCAYSAYVTNGNAAFIFGRGNPINGSIVGNLSWMADDGTDEVEAARISAQIDGTPGSNDMPGRLVFSTTEDGAAADP